MFTNPRSFFALFALWALMAANAPAQIQLALTTPLDGESRRDGIVFTVVPNQDVTIESFDVLLRGKSSPYLVKVVDVSQAGGLNPTAGPMLGTTTVTAVDSATPTPLNLNLGFQLRALEVRSFYIEAALLSTSQSTDGIVVSRTGDFPGTFAQDSVIEVRGGASTLVEQSGVTAFDLTSTSSQFNGVIRYSVDSPAQLDTAVVDITAPFSSDPTTCTSLSATELITFKIENDSTVVIPAGTPISADWTVTDEAGGVQTGNETFMPVVPIGPFGVETFTFGTFADLSGIGTFNVCVNAFTPGDIFAANDFFKTDVISGGAAPVPGGFEDEVDFFETVEVEGSKDLPVGMINDQNDAQVGSGSAFQNEWVVRSRMRLPGGPFGGFRSFGGGYATVDDSGEYDAVNMLSRCYDVTGTSDVFMRFFVYSNNVDPGGPTANENQLHVDVITQNGTVLMDVIPPIGHKGAFWCPIDIDLSTYNDVVQVRFRASTDNGGTSHNIAIDEISVRERYGIDIAVEDGGPSDTNLCDGGARCTILVVTNQGLQTLSAGTIITASHSVNGGPPVVENFILQDDLPPGFGAQFFFVQEAVILPGLNSTLVTATVAGDLEPANDTFVSEATGREGGVKAPFLETFDDQQPGFRLPLGWEQSNLPNSMFNGEWRLESMATQQPVPPSDHTEPGGLYVLNRDRGETSNIVLMTPCIDVSCLSEPYLNFFYYAVSSAPDGVTAPPGRTLHVDLLTYPGPVVTMDITPSIIATGRRWFLRSVPLAPGTGDIRIRFRAEDPNAAFNQVSFSIDDVSVTEKPGVGTGDDFSQRTLVNDTGKKSGQEYYQEALCGDTVTMELESPGGALVGGVPILLAEVFPDGSPPPQDGLFPGLHFSTGVQVVYDGFANQTPFGPPVLVPGGMTFNYTVPPGLDPFTVRTQWVVATQNAGNNIFASGPAQDLDIDR